MNSYGNIGSYQTLTLSVDIHSMHVREILFYLNPFFFLARRCVQFFLIDAGHASNKNRGRGKETDTK